MHSIPTVAWQVSCCVCRALSVKPSQNNNNFSIGCPMKMNTTTTMTTNYKPIHFTCSKVYVESSQTKPSESWYSSTTHGPQDSITEEKCEWRILCTSFYFLFAKIYYHYVISSAHDNNPVKYVCMLLYDCFVCRSQVSVVACGVAIFCNVGIGISLVSQQTYYFIFTSLP